MFFKFFFMFIKFFFQKNLKNIKKNLIDICLLSCFYGLLFLWVVVFMGCLLKFELVVVNYKSLILKLLFYLIKQHCHFLKY